MTPEQVGELPIVDFLVLCDGIENRLEHRNKAAENGIALGI